MHVRLIAVSIRNRELGQDVQLTASVQVRQALEPMMEVFYYLNLKTKAMELLTWSQYIWSSRIGWSRDIHSIRSCLGRDAI